MSEENKAIVSRLHEGVSRGDLNAIDESYARNMVYHGSGEMANADFDAFKQFVSAVLDAFPGFTITQDEVLADGDKVIYRSTYSGTHTGDFMGIPASGKTVSVSSIGIARISDGKIIEEWENMDELSLMQQLGVIPTD